MFDFNERLPKLILGVASDLPEERRIEMEFTWKRPAWLLSILWLAAICLSVTIASPAMADGQLPTFLEKVQPSELFEGADRFGEVEGDPPIAPVYRGDELLGYAYLNSDFTSSIGYSGKPIHIVVGIERSGIIRGVASP